MYYTQTITECRISIAKSPLFLPFILVEVSNHSHHFVSGETKRPLVFPAPGHCGPTHTRIVRLLLFSHDY
jgi:hypothetical protein